MAGNIHIRSAVDGNILFMYAKPEVLKEKKGTTFKIHNHVQSDNPLDVRFYLLDEKGVKGKEIAGFCTEMGPTKTVLSIQAKKDAKCTTPADVNSKYFAYTVENVDAETLDPVIIIDDALEAPGIGGPFGLFAMLLMGGGGILAGAFGYHFFMSRSKAAS